MQVRFSDESTAYDFAVAEITVLSYAPTTGKRGDLRVTDTIEILIATGDIEEQQIVKDALNNWLALAYEQWETVSQSRIYIEIKNNGDTDWRRSELLGGRLQATRQTLDSHSQFKQEYNLIIERKNWWEWPEIQLGLSDDNVTFLDDDLMILTSGAEPVYFGEVLGDPQTPVPVRIEIYNGGGFNACDTFYIAHNVFGALNPLTDQHILEGEDSTETGTVTANVYKRSDAYMARSWAGAIDENIFSWDLTAAQVAACAGRWYRVLAVINVPPASDLFLKVQLEYPGGAGAPAFVPTEYYINPTTDAGFQVVDLGAIQIPPTGFTSNPSPLVLSINGRSAVADDIGLDFVQLAPTDGFYKASLVTLYNALVTEWIKFDGRIGKAYIVDDDEYEYLDFAEGPPHISLWPGRSQWMTILHDNRVNGVEVNDTWGIQAFYRPRRVTV